MTSTFFSAYAYLANGGGGLSIIDVANPDAPRLRGVYSPVGSMGLQVSNGYAFSAGGNLRVVDIGNPARPTLCGFYPVFFGPGSNNDLFVDGDLVYLASGLTGLSIYQFTGRQTATRHWPLYP
jgi:hypothetical protein